MGWVGGKDVEGKGISNRLKICAFCYFVINLCSEQVGKGFVRPYRFLSILCTHLLRILDDDELFFLSLARPTSLLFRYGLLINLNHRYSFYGCSGRGGGGVCGGRRHVVGIQGQRWLIYRRWQYKTFSYKLISFKSSIRRWRPSVKFNTGIG